MGGIPRRALAPAVVLGLVLAVLVAPFGGAAPSGPLAHAPPAASGTLNESLRLIAFTASPTVLTLGTWTNFTAIVVGGADPLTYHYLGLPPGCTDANVSKIGCRPTEAGDYNVILAVHDRNLTRVNDTLLLEVTTDPPGYSAAYVALASAAWGVVGLVSALEVMVFADIRRERRKAAAAALAPAPPPPALPEGPAPEPAAPDPEVAGAAPPPAEDFRET